MKLSALDFQCCIPTVCSNRYLGCRFQNAMNPRVNGARPFGAKPQARNSTCIVRGCKIEMERKALLTSYRSQCRLERESKHWITFARRHASKPAFVYCCGHTRSLLDLRPAVVSIPRGKGARATRKLRSGLFYRFEDVRYRIVMMVD